MARDFEDHCWKDVIDADTIQIYQAYRRKIFVGDNPAVLAIDLYNKAYRGGDHPVKEVDREFSGSCGEHAWKALPPTQKLLVAARRAGVPIIYTTRHVDTAGVHSTNRNIGREADDTYDIKAELAPLPGELVIYKERASGFFGTPLIAHLQQKRINSLIICGESTSGWCASTVDPLLASTTWWSGVRLRPLADQSQGQPVRSASQIRRRHAYRGGAGASRWPRGQRDRHKRIAKT
jgi:nicotinamidase-related amidase